MSHVNGTGYQPPIGPNYQDSSTMNAILDLLRRNPVGFVTGNELYQLIYNGTQDLDNQAAGQEYSDIRQFATQNWNRLTPDARAKFFTYEKYAQAAQMSGKTGINMVDYSRMLEQMKNTNLPDVGQVIAYDVANQIGQMYNGIQNSLPIPLPNYNIPVGQGPQWGSAPGFGFPNANGAPEWGVAADEKARVWGDPHFEDPDGGRFDVQGEAGKTYNLLNDTGLQFNGKFEKWGDGNLTVVGETGLTVAGPGGVSQVQYNKDGVATINGRRIQPGAMETLADGGTAHLSEDGKTFTIKTREGYTITQKSHEGYIDADVKSSSQGVNTDGRMPGGLIGQTFDKDKLARNGNGSQGEGAIEGSYKDYEVGAGVLGAVPPGIQKGVSPHGINFLGNMFGYLGMPFPGNLPGANPLSGAPINWNQSIGNQSFDFFTQQMNRQNMQQQMASSNEKTNKLIAMLMILLQTGNIDLAMLVIAQIETKEAQGMVTTLTANLQQAQAQRRNLSAQMGMVNGQQGGQQQGGQNPIYNLQTGVQETNDTIQMLTTMIKDINDQKNRTVEFANNFLSTEHQTTMNVVRGMRG